MNNPANRLRSMRDYLASASKCSGMPLCCAIEVTSRCNLDCVFCNRSSLDRPDGDMDKRLFQQIVDGGKDFLEFVYLNGAGESCLHPDLPELVEHCTRNGIITQLPTNGTLLTPELSSDLLDAGLGQFLIGIDGVNAQTYERVRRGADYRQLADNVRMLAELKLKKRSSTSIVIQMVLIDDNRSEAGLLEPSWRIPGIDGVRLKADERAGARTGPSYKSSNRKQCLFAWQGPYWINCNGDLMHHGYGHSDEQTVQRNYSEVLSPGFRYRSWREVVNGPEMIEFRSCQARRRFDLCGPCSGCRAYGPPPHLAWATFLPNNGRLRLAVRHFENASRLLGFSRLMPGLVSD
ncbi:MAG: radical SAM protein [Candidatus Alcyoniella australis]|nr:radical SAM protein [Candidatus Alcyoniella australis]